MARRRSAPTASTADAAFDTDVLIIGAGPTGLTLARELHSLGVSARLIDSAADAAHESRALAIQARTLEVLARNRLADDLVTAGNPSTTLLLHERTTAATGRTHAIPLFDSALGDTRFPFLLFLSQAATERVLVERLTSTGVGIRRGLTLTGLTQDPTGVTATLESPGAPARVVRARYLVGCDGAHSTTRHLAGIDFSGRAYAQRFLLADVEIDGLEPGRVHVYLARSGPLFVFPLGHPASWRVLVELPRSTPAGPITLPLVQAAVSRHTREQLVLRDPAWLAEFTVSSRLADSFRLGRVFLAGDAAHIHSPAGAQGMNTGIQDAVNLGWKLALVCRGEARPALLETYQRERMPVARSVLATTDRAFRVATAQVPLVRDLRAALGPRLAAVVLRSGLVRRAGFRLISELGIQYRRSPLSVEGQPRPAGGPRPGQRFPQPGMGTTTGVTRPAEPRPSSAPNGPGTPNGPARRPPVFRLLLCGPAGNWPAARVREFAANWAHLVEVEHRPDAPRSRWSAAPRAAATSSRRPGTAQYLVRWDGYVGFRTGGTDLAGVAGYLRRLGARPRSAPETPRGQAG
ncbi:FAD-dependent monooxygenase [Cryobacterium sp. 1639]|uniref:FAD-dependent monooxygenase n=1 Tax=Cryobacterium inferilacus TaxID=2866629 RepID=UPI001C72CB3D|nr:FAD-dependent monooxygenase [Cryobacterium sp. 1639]MBX0300170.1 FAD-dependent monooxygenase [Cryobacterium sp. 1639]